MERTDGVNRQLRQLVFIEQQGKKTHHLPTGACDFHYTAKKQIDAAPGQPFEIVRAWSNEQRDERSISSDRFR
jgi:hypothetical protein